MTIYRVGYRRYFPEEHFGNYQTHKKAMKAIEEWNEKNGPEFKCTLRSYKHDGYETVYFDNIDLFAIYKEELK